MQNALQKVTETSQSLSRRKAGRPSGTQIQGDELKQHVLQAASVAYGEWGFHACSVEKIASAAGISRPLFYRLFGSKEEVLDDVVAKTNHALVSATRKSVGSADSVADALDAAIDAYFTWCREYKNVVRSIYRELNEPRSPACKQYQSTLESLQHFHIENFTRLGFSPEPALILTLSKVVEFTGNMTIQTDAVSADEITKQRDVARHVLFSSLGLDVQSERAK